MTIGEVPNSRRGITLTESEAAQIDDKLSTRRLAALQMRLKCRNGKQFPKLFIASELMLARGHRRRDLALRGAAGR